MELEGYLKSAIKLNGNFSFDGDIDYKEPPISPTSEAAVLVLINNFDQPKLLLTQRQNNMRKHPGQVAFPGGRVDNGDKDHWATALREANEEIGLPLAHPLSRIGTLDLHQTITGFTVTPCVALNSHSFDYELQDCEVAHIFEIPLTEIQPNNFRIEGRDYNGLKRHYYVLPHDNHFIWGATARMLHNFGKRLSNVGYF